MTTTEQSEQSKLPFSYGLWNQCPEDAPAAWGARAILHQGGHLDFLGDRMTSYGVTDQAKKSFLQYLNEKVVLSIARPRAKELYELGDICGSENNTVVLYEDEKIICKGNARRSYGYFYLICYPKPEAYGDFA